MSGSEGQGTEGTFEAVRPTEEEMAAMRSRESFEMETEGDSDGASVFEITDDEDDEVDHDDGCSDDSDAEMYDAGGVDSRVLEAWITPAWAAKVEASPNARYIKEVFDVIKQARADEVVGLSVAAMETAQPAAKNDPDVFTLTALWLVVLIDLTSATIEADFWAQKKFIKAFTQSGKTFYTILDGIFKCLHGYDVVLFGTSDGSTYDHIQSAVGDVASEFKRLTYELSESNPFRLVTPVHFWRLNQPRPLAAELECTLNVRVAQIFNVRSFFRDFGDKLDNTHVSLDEAHTIFGGAQVHHAFRDLIFEVPSATYVSATCELNQIMHGGEAITVVLKPRPGYYMELEEPDVGRSVFKLQLEPVENVSVSSLDDFDLEPLTDAFSNRNGVMTLAPRWISHLAEPSARNFMHVVINPLLASNGEGGRGRSANAGHVAIARWLAEQHAMAVEGVNPFVFGFAMYQTSRVLPTEYYRPRLFMDKRIYNVLNKSASRRRAFIDNLGRIFTTNKEEANSKNEVSEKVWGQIHDTLSELSAKDEGDKTVSLELGFRPTPKIINSLILLIYATVARLGFKENSMAFHDERKWTKAFTKNPLQIFFVGSHLLRHSVNVESKCRNIQVTHLTSISKHGGREGLAEKHQQVGRVNHGLWTSCFGHCAFHPGVRNNPAAMPPTLYMSPPLLEQLQLKFRADEKMAEEIRAAVLSGEEVDPEETAERYGKRTRAANNTHMGSGKMVREHTDAAFHRGGKKARLGPLSDDHIQWRRNGEWADAEIDIEDPELKQAYKDWVKYEATEGDLTAGIPVMYSRRARVFLEATQWTLQKLASTSVTIGMISGLIDDGSPLQNLNAYHVRSAVRRFQKYLAN